MAMQVEGHSNSARILTVDQVAPKFPSKLKEPKVVIVYRNKELNDSFIMLHETFKKENIRTERLDVNTKSNEKYLQMFEDGPTDRYPKVFIYESNDADFICLPKNLQSMIDDDEFEECIGRNEFEEDPFNETEFLTKSQQICESKEFQKKKISRYTSEELAAYMMEQSLNDLTRNMIKYKVSGKDLKKIQNPQQLMKLLHLKNKESADDFFEIIQEEREKHIAMISNQAFAETSDRWLNKPMMKWSTREAKGWIKSFITDEEDRKFIFTAFDTHAFNGRRVLRHDDIESLCEELEIDVDSIMYTKKYVPILKKIISAANIQMDKEFDSDEKTAINESLKPKFRVRDFRKHDMLRSSKHEDCIMKYNNDDGIARAAMECGHAIASDTMFYYIKQTFASNYTAADIACPVPKCHKKWDWGICTMVADMDNDELTYYNKLRTKRIYTNLTECRNCGKMVDRPKDLTQMKVVCSCSNVFFCFQCGLQWKQTDSNIICGNKSCVIVKDLNKTLQTQSWNDTEVSRQTGRKLPKIRACPRCLTLVIHKHGCKWMPCKGCKKVFCFCCLSVAKDDGTLTCTTGNDHFGQCPVADIQQFG